MMCDIGDNSRRRLDAPIAVQCKVCNLVYNVRVFPLRAPCGGSDVQDFIDHVEGTTTGLGDIVGKAIETVTFGMVKSSEGCGCEKRKAWLNNLWSWRTDESQA
jgi:hypothetical protein